MMAQICRSLLVSKVLGHAEMLRVIAQPFLSLVSEIEFGPNLLELGQLNYASFVRRVRRKQGPESGFRGTRWITGGDRVAGPGTSAFHLQHCVEDGERPS